MTTKLQEEIPQSITLFLKPSVYSYVNNTHFFEIKLNKIQNVFEFTKFKFYEEVYKHCIIEKNGKVECTVYYHIFDDLIVFYHMFIKNLILKLSYFDIELKGKIFKNSCWFDDQIVRFEQNIEGKMDLRFNEKDNTLITYNHLSFDSLKLNQFYKNKQFEILKKIPKFFNLNNFMINSKSIYKKDLKLEETEITSFEYPIKDNSIKLKINLSNSTLIIEQNPFFKCKFEEGSFEKGIYSYYNNRHGCGESNFFRFSHFIGLFKLINVPKNLPKKAFVKQTKLKWEEGFLEFEGNCFFMRLPLHKRDKIELFIENGFYNSITDEKMFKIFKKIETKSIDVSFKFE